MPERRAEPRCEQVHIRGVMEVLNGSLLLINEAIKGMGFIRRLAKVP